MAQTEHSPRSSQARLTVAIAAVALVTVTLFGAFAGPASATVASPSVHGVAAEPGDTTTTTPLDNRVQGNSITRPNEGADPQSPSDPGGWLQVSLFYLICGGVIGMAGIVWFSSRRTRARQVAAGTDPLSRAKASGKGVRAPSPLDTTTKPTASADAP